MATSPIDRAVDPIAHNTETILALEQQDNKSLSHHQRILELSSEVVGSPTFLGIAISFVSIWIAANYEPARFHIMRFDAAPFPILQGIVGLGALLVTIVVLIRQNRLGKMEERRAHLELQVNLLTEQNVTKLIELIEELRRDSPAVKNRYDPQAAAYQIPTNPEAVLKALDDRQDA